LPHWGEHQRCCRPLLAGLDLTGAVVTADALHTHADAAGFLVTSKQAHYLLVVKANQPSLLDRCVGLPWHDAPVLDGTRDQAHGRVELRTLKAVTVRGFAFPHAAQVVQVTRKTRDLGTRRWRTVVVYAVTSLTFAQARPHPARRPHPGALGDRERPALRPRRDLRRGRLPAAHRKRPAGSWPACATWSSGRSATPGRSTSPPPYASTPATPPGPGHPRDPLG
jgi:hypothetical protein